MNLRFAQKNEKNIKCFIFSRMDDIYIYINDMIEFRIVLCACVCWRKKTEARMRMQCVFVHYFPTKSFWFLYEKYFLYLTMYIVYTDPSADIYTTHIFIYFPLFFSFSVFFIPRVSKSPQLPMSIENFFSFQQNKNKKKNQRHFHKWLLCWLAFCKQLILQ